MGSGKSAVGRRLAADLGLQFVDSDEEVEARTGADIPLIFDKEGESGFRRREATAIDELTQRSGIVLATGGGAPLDPLSRRLLAERGTVIYLYTSVAEQLRRTGHNRNRPLLDCADPGAVLTELLRQRDPVYREIADIIVTTDGRQVAGVARDIRKQLQAVDDSAEGTSESA